MEAETEDEKVRAITSKYPQHFEIVVQTTTTTSDTTTSDTTTTPTEPRNKVLCKLTKHQLPLNAEAIQTYIDGKKFQSYLKKVKQPSTVEKLDNKYSELFRPSKRFPTTRLYCTLTRKEINKKPHEIERYITGYKFLKAVARHEERKEKGEPEPMEEEEEEEEKKEDGEEEDEVPFYALSSEGEDEVEEGDKAGDLMDEDENDIIEEEEDVIEEEDGEAEDCHKELTEEEETIKNMEIAKNIMNIENNNKGKKRKSKEGKSKKNKKSKKLKAAGT